MRDLWESLKETLRSQLPESSYQVWIAPLTYGGTDGDTIDVHCPNQFFASWVREHYLSVLNKELSENGERLKIRLVPSEIAKEAARSQLHLPNFAPNELPRPCFCERFNFEEFVVGDSNRYAYSACLAAACGENSPGKVIYLHSDAGLGKSHLTHAVGQKILDSHPEARLCYLTANEFTTQVVRAIKNGEMDSFKRRYQEGCDVLLLEEVHVFSGRERTQAELAVALDPLLDQGKTVIFTSSRLPRQIPKISDHLRSRLGSGMITSINPPDLNTRRRILIRKARCQGVKLDDDIVDFLARHLAGDVRQIEGAVIGLVAKSSLLRQPIDMDLAREIIRETVGEPDPITLDNIRDLICRHFKLTTEQICSRSRKKAVSWPRQIAMYLARRYTDASLEAIGRELNRDHATVSHSIKRIKKQLNESSSVRQQVTYLIEQLEKKRWT